MDIYTFFVATYISQAPAPPFGLSLRRRSMRLTAQPDCLTGCGWYAILVSRTHAGARFVP